MPPSLRRRAQHHLAPPEEPEESDSEVEFMPRRQVEEEDEEAYDQDGDELLEEELDEEDAQGSLDDVDNSPPDDPPPPYFREISTLASWTVSSSKPGCSVPQLRSPLTNLFWQSDGPQPHYLNIHFFKLVRIVGLRLYLDFEQDESYTPTRIIFLAGSGMNDLQEWGEMRLDNPRGWIWADLSGVGDVSDSDDDGLDNEGDSAMPDAHPPSLGTPRGLPAPEIGTPIPPFFASSDSENAAPPQRPDLRSAFSNEHEQHMQLQPTTPAVPQTSPRRARRTAHQTPIQHQQQATHTTTTTAANNNVPPFTRSTPRTPFTALATSSPHPGAPPHSTETSARIPKLPTLRAHLVQIKILENHQNGKDTHLRGLQVFAMNEETGKAERVVRGASSNSGSGLNGGDEGGDRNGVVGRDGTVKKKGRKGRGEVLELGGWGDEGSIR